MDETIALALTNLGYTIGWLIQSFEERTFLGSLRGEDLRSRAVKKAISEILALIKLIDDFRGTSKDRYHGILSQHSYALWAQVCKYVMNKSQDVSMADIKLSEEFGKVTAFLNRKPQQAAPVRPLNIPRPAAAQPQQNMGEAPNPNRAAPMPGAAAQAPPPQPANQPPHVAIPVNEPINPQGSLFDNLWLRLANFFIFAKTEEFAQYNFFRKGLWWIMKAIQYPLTAIIDFTEAVLRTTIRNIFYYLRHPNLIISKNVDVDSDEDINLNPIQYGIKEIAVGLDKTLENLFALKNLAIHPYDSSVGLYQVIKKFLTSENKWEQFEEAVNKKFEHIKAHPLQYLPDLIILLVGIIVPIVHAGGPTGGAAATLATITTPVVLEETITAGVYLVPAFAGPVVLPTFTIAPAALFSGMQLVAEGAVVGAAVVAGVEGVPSLLKNSSKEVADRPAKSVEESKIAFKVSNPPSRIKELQSNLVFLKDCLGLYSGESDKEIRDKIIEEIDLIREAMLRLDPASTVIAAEIKAAEATATYLIKSLSQYKLPNDEKLIAQVNDELKAQQQELQKLKLLVEKHSKPPAFNADRDVSNRTSYNKKDVFLKQFDSNEAQAASNREAQAAQLEDLPDHGAVTEVVFAPG